MKTWILATALFALISSAHAQIGALRPAATAASASASVSIFATITGQKSGVIKGEVTQKGRESSHQILDFDLGVMSPRDAASGLPTGRRQHKPLRIVKKITSASPLLFTSITNNENLTSVRLDFYEPNRATGVEVLSQSITLQNATISSWRQFVDPEMGLVEEIQFTYQKITIENKQGGTMGQDNWSAPNV